MKQLAGQFVKFGIVGVMNTAIDAAVYIALTRSSAFFADHYLTAAFIAFIVAGVNGYIWSKRWTFQDERQYSNKQLLTFYLAAAIALVLNQTFLWGFVQLGIHDIVAKLGASVSAGSANFLLQKFWTFRPQPAATSASVQTPEKDL